MTAAKPPARQRAVGALASGSATAELHHHRGHDPAFRYDLLSFIVKKGRIGQIGPWHMRVSPLEPATQAFSACGRGCRTLAAVFPGLPGPLNEVYSYLIHGFWRGHLILRHPSEGHPLTREDALEALRNTTAALPSPGLEALEPIWVRFLERERASGAGGSDEPASAARWGRG